MQLTNMFRKQSLFPVFNLNFQDGVEDPFVVLLLVYNYGCSLTTGFIQLLNLNFGKNNVQIFLCSQQTYTEEKF